MNAELIDLLDPTDEEIRFIAEFQRELWLAQYFDGDDDHQEIHINGWAEASDDPYKSAFFIDGILEVSPFAPSMIIYDQGSLFA